MKKDDVKKFELNKSVLKDFDVLMSLRLDFVEELVVTEMDSEAKLLNIISLCTNVKSLIIQGDNRIKTDSVISNIFKPGLLKTLILNGVKVPTNLKKLVNLNSILLKNVKFCKVGKFLQELPNPDKVTEISLCNVDFGGTSIDVLKRFTNLQFINLDKINDCEFSNLRFLSENESLKKLIIKNNNINIREANSLISGKYTKNISVKMDKTDTLDINEKNECSITIGTDDLKQVIQKINLSKIDTAKIIVNEENNILKNIKHLKHIKRCISISVKDISYLELEDLREIKKSIFVDKIYLRDEIGEKAYTTGAYIKIRKEIDNLIVGIDKDITEVGKFLEIYRILGENIEIDDLMETAATDITKLENALEEKKCTSMTFAKILQYCLSCLDIQSRIVDGYYKNDDNLYLWNQVKIDGDWYNVDIVKDSKYIAKQGLFKVKVKNCLIEDNIFYKTHTANTTNVASAPKSYDKQEISMCLNETDLFQKIIDVILRIFAYNRQEALPVAKREKK